MTCRPIRSHRCYDPNTNQYVRCRLLRSHIIYDHPVLRFDGITRRVRLRLRRLRRAIPACSRSWGGPRAGWRMRGRWEVNDSYRHNLRHIWADIQVGDSDGSHPPGISLVTLRILLYMSIAHRTHTKRVQTQIRIFRSKPADMKPELSGSHLIAVTVSVWVSIVRMHRPDLGVNVSTVQGKCWEGHTRVFHILMWLSELVNSIESSRDHAIHPTGYWWSRRTRSCVYSL